MPSFPQATSRISATAFYFNLVCLLGACLLAFVVSRFVLWQWAANALLVQRADTASRLQAVEYAPQDAYVVATLGKHLVYHADPVQPAEGLNALQRAAQLAPVDYRYPLELGRAYQANGQFAEAVAAMQQAVQLAPRYFETYWALGNLHARNGQRAQALAAFQQAVTLAGPQPDQPDERATLAALNVLQGAFGNDQAAFEQLAETSQLGRIHLANFLTQPDSLALALAKAAALPTQLEPHALPAYRKLLIRLLDETERAGRYADATQLWQKLSTFAPAWQQAVADPANLLTNPGFELPSFAEQFNDIVATPLGFDWQFTPHQEARALRSDSVVHTGQFAMRLRLVTRLKSDFRHAAQLVPVAAQQRYRLQCWVNARELPDPAPYLEISDAQQPQLFRLTLPLPRDTREWQAVELSFTTAASTQAVRIRLCLDQRAAFDETRRNELWLDDFSLRRE